MTHNKRTSFRIEGNGSIEKATSKRVDSNKHKIAVTLKYADVSTKLIIEPEQHTHNHPIKHSTQFITDRCSSALVELDMSSGLVLEALERGETPDKTMIERARSARTEFNNYRTTIYTALQ